MNGFTGSNDRYMHGIVYANKGCQKMFSEVHHFFGTFLCHISKERKLISDQISNFTIYEQKLYLESYDQIRLLVSCYF